MALDPLSGNSKIAVYNSDVSLTDKTAAPKSQGATVADLGGFIKVKDTAGAPASGVKGDIVFSIDDRKIYIHTGDEFVATAALTP